jgi:hypothetical protein
MISVIHPRKALTVRDMKEAFDRLKQFLSIGKMPYQVFLSIKISLNQANSCMNVP